MTNIASLDWSLVIDCPNCHEDIDLVQYDHDNDYTIAKMIFTNNWDKIEGHEVICTHCEHEFTIDKVEY